MSEQPAQPSGPVDEISLNRDAQVGSIGFVEAETDILRAHFHRVSSRHGVCSSEDLPGLMRRCGFAPSKKMLAAYQEEIKDAGDLMSFGTFLDYCRRCRMDTPDYSPGELLEFCKSLNNGHETKDSVPVKIMRNLLANIGEPLNETELENFIHDFADSGSDSVDCARMLRQLTRVNDKNMDSVIS